MKRLKISLGITTVILALSSALFFNSCTKDFEELNTNKAKLTTLGEQELPYLFSKAQSASSFAWWKYQVAQNLFSDLYSQYFALTATYFPSDRYVMRMDWLQWHWIPIYTEAVPQMKTLLTHEKAGDLEKALTKVWWVYTFHRVTDYYGPIPYSQAGEALESVPYDSQEAIYKDFFAKLDEAESVLKANAGGTSKFGNFDLMYGGKVDNWIKFANTLRLRLALRVSKVDPALGKTNAEKAVAGGVMTDVADDAMMYKTAAGSDFNGLNSICGWNEFRMSASMESVLKGYEDPRVAEMYSPCVATGTYEGLRNGLSATEQGNPANGADANSNVGPRYVVDRRGEQEQDIMHAAEAYFLRAEGALNGWSMGGNAKDLYESGIRTSMAQWGFTGAGVDAYISSSKTPIAPGDQQNSPAMTDIPVAWGGSEEVQREQIGTQKWIALYPDGIEAWAEIRRMNYPKLYPVVNTDNPDLPVGTPIRRIPFLTVEKTGNASAVEAAKSLLGGPDNCATRLWWDKD